MEGPRTTVDWIELGCVRWRRVGPFMVEAILGLNFESPNISPSIRLARNLLAGMCGVPFCRLNIGSTGSNDPHQPALSRIVAHPMYQHFAQHFQGTEPSR